MTKFEIVYIRRNGLNLLHTEGADYAAKVTYLAYTPGQTYDPRNGIKAEWLVPMPNMWAK